MMGYLSLDSLTENMYVAYMNLPGPGQNGDMVTMNGNKTILDTFNISFKA